MNVVSRLVLALKQRAQLRFPAAWSGWTWNANPRTRIDYAGEVDTAGSPLVEAIARWLGRTIPEAPVRVQQRGRGAELRPIPDHPLPRLLERPNDHYSGPTLWSASIGDWVRDGNFYWFKERSARERVAQLWWLPAHLVEPVGPADGSRYIDYYEYRPGGTPIQYDPADIVHVRDGLDRRNPRKGCSPLKTALLELFTDHEAALYSATLLRNLAIPGVILAPRAPVTAGGAERQRIEDEYAARFGGDRRGLPLVLTAPTDVTPLSFSPEQMNLRDLRQMPETRVSSLLGVPAIVVGFDVGLQRSTFANFSEAREAAYEGTVIPTQRIFAAELFAQLLPEFGPTERLVLDFDLTDVRALQPDLDKLWTRLNSGIDAGWLMVDEARSEAGLPPLADGQGQVLYLKSTVLPTNPASLLPPEASEEEEEEPALEEPPPVRALPPPKHQAGPAERKAADFADALLRLRARMLERFAAALARQLRAAADRAASRLDQPKAEPDWENEVERLNAVLARWYRRVLGAVHPLAEDFLGASFELDDPTTRAFLEGAGANVRGIVEHTRAELAAALQAGQAEGEGVGALAERVRELGVFSPARARLIARSELALASNAAAIASYTASGLVGAVRILDGDGCGLRSHDDPQKADGMVIPIDQMAGIPLLAHPNCVRALSPVLTVNGELVA